MHIFRFNNPPNVNENTLMVDGEIVNGLRSKLWIERYRDPGEFKFTAPIDSNVRENLPIGAFISHLQTEEIMMVEDHFIQTRKGEPPEIAITGRTMEVLLENRIVGSNLDHLLNPALAKEEYILPEDPSLWQAEKLIEDHIILANLNFPEDEIPNVVVNKDTIVPIGWDEVERVLPKNTVHAELMALLKIDNFGISVYRPSVKFADTTVSFSLRGGSNRSGDIVFSSKDGELEGADYFWSLKGSSTAAYVFGKWVSVIVDDGDLEKADRRMIPVEASDLDEQYDAMPSGSTLTRIRSLMTERGKKAILAHKPRAIVSADPTGTESKYVYNKDYFIGDFVSVRGDYDTNEMMRVVEFTFIEDEQETNAVPTLAPDNPTPRPSGGVVYPAEE